MEHQARERQEPMMSRNVALLVTCQAVLLTGAVVTVSTSALVGSRLAPQQSLATLPIFMSGHRCDGHGPPGGHAYEEDWT